MIESGICINPEGNTGNEVKHRVATKMLGAKIKDFTPSKVVFCADSEQIFLELINESFYNLDIIFRVPKNGGDDQINKMADLLCRTKIDEIKKFGDDFYPDTEIWFYRDNLSSGEKNNFETKFGKTNLEQIGNKIILSDKGDFESKFGSKIDETTGKVDFYKNGQNIALNKVEHAKTQAENLIKMGNTGKQEFENLFPELNVIFGFDS